MGVQPDYEVDNDPKEEKAGEDRQLEKGIQVLRQMIEERGRVQPERPPPVKKVVKIAEDCAAA